MTSLAPAGAVPALLWAWTAMSILGVLVSFLVTAARPSCSPLPRAAVTTWLWSMASGSTTVVIGTFV